MTQAEKIFKLFEPGTPSEEVVEDDYEIKYITGVFIKLMDNYNLSHKYVLDLFGRASKELNLDEINEVGNFLIYNKAWDYLSRIDLKNKSQINYIQNFQDPKFLNYIDRVIDYFISTEEYENCKFLHDLKQLSKLPTP